MSRQKQPPPLESIPVMWSDNQPAQAQSNDGSNGSPSAVVSSSQTSEVFDKDELSTFSMPDMWQPSQAGSPFLRIKDEAETLSLPKSLSFQTNGWELLWPYMKSKLDESEMLGWHLASSRKCIGDGLASKVLAAHREFIEAHYPADRHMYASSGSHSSLSRASSEGLENFTKRTNTISTKEAMEGLIGKSGIHKSENSGSTLVSTSDNFSGKNRIEEISKAVRLSMDQLQLISFAANAALWEFVRSEKIEAPEYPRVRELEGAFLFTDLSGFSALCQRLVDFASTSTKKKKNREENYASLEKQRAAATAAQDLNFIVNKYLESEIEVIHQYGGDVILFAGDAMLVVFEPEISFSSNAEQSKSAKVDSDAQNPGSDAENQLPRENAEMSAAAPKVSEDALQKVSLNATACALELLKVAAEQRNNMPPRLKELGKMELHIGLGMGKLKVLNFGSASRALCVVHGPACAEANVGEGLASSGELVVSDSIMQRLEVACSRASRTESADLSEQTTDNRKSITINCQEISEDSIKIALEDRPLASTSKRYFKVFGLSPTVPKPSLFSSKRVFTLKALSSCVPVSGDLNGMLDTVVRLFVPMPIQLLVDSGQEMTTGQEMRSITCMFFRLFDLNADVLAYKNMTDIRIMQQALLVMYDLLERYDGMLARFQIDDKGSVLKIVFGAPSMSHQDDPVRAIHFAIEAQRRLQEIKLQACIGIATGAAMFALVGSIERREYTAVGSAVILAARLMQQAKCEIIVDEQTFRVTRGSINYQHLPASRVKGYRLPIRMFRALDKLKITKLLAPIKDPNLVIGREKELNAITDAVSHNIFARNSTSRTVFIEGANGSGKSMVLSRALGILSETQDYVIFKSVADEVEQATPYFIWRDIVKSILAHLKIINDDSMDQRQARGALQRDRLARKLKQQYNRSTLEQLDRFLRLGLKIGQESDPKKAQEVEDGTKVREFIFAKVRDLLQAGSATKRLVIVIHGGQWIDSASWTLLNSCSKSKEIVFLISSRTMLDKPFELRTMLKSEGSLSITLQPLDEDVAITMVSKYLNNAQLPDIIKSIIPSVTGGNPAQCKELAELLVDREYISIEQDRVTLRKSEQAIRAISSVSTQMNVQFRVDKMTSASQWAVKFCAVAGSQVTPHMIYVCSHGSLSDLEQAEEEMQNLIESNFIIRSGKDGSYRFLSEPAMLFLRSMIPDDMLGGMHLDIATYYEDELADKQADSNLNRISHHLSAAAFIFKTNKPNVLEKAIKAKQNLVEYVMTTAKENSLHLSEEIRGLKELMSLRHNDAYSTISIDNLLELADGDRAEVGKYLAGDLVRAVNAINNISSLLCQTVLSKTSLVECAKQLTRLFHEIHASVFLDNAAILLHCFKRIVDNSYPEIDSTDMSDSFFSPSSHTSIDTGMVLLSETASNDEIREIALKAFDPLSTWLISIHSIVKSLDSELWEKLPTDVKEFCIMASQSSPAFKKSASTLMLK